ncbi:MAG: histidine triad nucleotide-binding protein [Clostridiales bacterium]|jgi:histidine triad (HIT) family protein|nr:histidine triad nucleotide-binding protein [Clostridiales bacterium]
MGDCIFCKIISGDLPSTKIYEDKLVLAFKDINPQMPVHIILVPKIHIESILNLTEETTSIAGYMQLMIKKIALQEGLDKNGFRVISNCGKDAGQTVPHLHYHILAGKNMGEKLFEI